MGAHPDRFDPVDPATQPLVPVPGYPNTIIRNPARAPFRRTLSRTELTGPLDLVAKLRPEDNNLAVLAPGRMAQGQLIHVGGRVLDEDGRPVAGAVVELWQANGISMYPVLKF